MTVTDFRPAVSSRVAARVLLAIIALCVALPGMASAGAILQPTAVSTTAAQFIPIGNTIDHSGVAIWILAIPSTELSVSSSIGVYLKKNRKPRLTPRLQQTKNRRTPCDFA